MKFLFLHDVLVYVRYRDFKSINLKKKKSKEKDTGNKTSRTRFIYDTVP